MPTTLLSHDGSATYTYSTQLAHDHYTYPHDSPYFGQGSAATSERLSTIAQQSAVNSASIVRDIDGLAALLVGSTAANSIWMGHNMLTAIGSGLDLDVRIAVAAQFLSAGYLADDAIGELWEGYVRPSFKPMIGQVTQADRLMASRATSGRIISSEIIPRFEEE